MLIVLCGQPNSGKSAILGCLTKSRVVTSNYPGTTVEVTRGSVPGKDIEILDTPGIYSLHALTKEQLVTKKVLFQAKPHVIVNVLDGTCLERHLCLTLSLLELGIPLVLAVNRADSLEKAGTHVDCAALSELTGVPVVLTSAVTRQGIDNLLKAAIAQSAKVACPVSAAALPSRPDVKHLQSRASSIYQNVVTRTNTEEDKTRKLLLMAEETLDRPIPAWIALGVGLWVLWKFTSWALPFAEKAVVAILSPLRVLLERLMFLVLPQGALWENLARAIPEGFVLPASTVLPAMILAYSVIALLEDSGLLSRYAAMGHSATTALNLPGQSLVPLMLGFGCRVPAILSTRILPGEKSRKTACLIIATCVPCTATISLSMVALARFRGAFSVPVLAILASATGLGLVSRWVLVGEREPLVLELPRLQMPIWRNIAMKTGMRLSGFFSHVLPLMVLVNVAVRLLLTRVSWLGAPWVSSISVKLLGIPPGAMVAVLATMVQRYLAPLFLLQQDLSPREATIAVTMLALGFPCLPSAAVLWKELGVKYVILAFAASFVLFMGWGMVLNRLI